jgi:hypothetical protein
MPTLRSYFTSATEQRRALEALGDFFQVVELDLYDASVCAFDLSSSAEEAFRCFLYIYNELSGHNWNVWRSRNPAPHWPPEQIFETIRREFSEFSPGGPVNLLNFRKSATTLRLQSYLAKMIGIKPNKGFPIMTVSKFLHFYNPALFPIYDTEVIYNKVINGCFKSNFRDFCDNERLPYRIFMNEDTVDFLPAYMRWASSHLSVAHGSFMQVFTDWLGDQPGADLSRRKFDPTMLYARAFEYTAIGAAKAEGW